MQAMILAAGFGTRLLPHTRICPKPLFPLLGKPLLLLTIEHLQALGFTKIVVNCHYLSEQIEAAIARCGVIVQKEEKLLGTGGGLRRAMEHFTDESVLVTNGDIYHTINLLKLYHHHRQKSRRITLAMHNCPRFNNVFCEKDEVCNFASKEAEQQNKLAYTGVQVVEPEALAGIFPDQFSCIIAHYKNLLNAGEKIGCFRADSDKNFFWTDIGTPQDYLDLHGELLFGNIPCWPELNKPESPFLIAEDADIANCRMEGWGAVGSGVKMEDGCSLARSVVWDNMTILQQTRVENALISGVENE